MTDSPPPNFDAVASNERTTFIAANAELYRDFLRIALARGSRKATWELLSSAALCAEPLRWFYAQSRKDGLESTIALFFTEESLAIVRGIVANPPPPPPPRVAVSTIANQYYCEMQVHLATLHDVRVTSSELTAGTEGHAKLEAEAEPITQDEIKRRMETGEAMGLVELNLSGEINGVTIMGRADRVQLEGTTAKLLLEWKFSSRRELYSTHIMQVETYATLLKANGFNIDNLVHVVAVIQRGRVRPEKLAETMAQRAHEIASVAPWGTRVPGTSTGMPDPLQGLGVRRLDSNSFTLFVFPHHAPSAERHLQWALGYWKGERAPTHTTSPSRCRACPYNAAHLCDVARAPTDGRFRQREIVTREGEKIHLLIADRPGA